MFDCLIFGSSSVCFNNVRLGLWFSSVGVGILSALISAAELAGSSIISFVDLLSFVCKFLVFECVLCSESCPVDSDGLCLSGFLVQLPDCRFDFIQVLNND